MLSAVAGHGFVGRAAQLAELDSALAAARIGRGWLTLVVGEPGIGKTRLARETADRARATGSATAWASCWDGGAAPALWPWVQLVREVAATDPDVPGVAGLVDALLDGTPDAGPSPTRFRLFDATERVLRAAAARRPWLLVVDDLQWADATSAQLLDFLAPQLPGLPVAVLATVRDGAAGLPRATSRIELSGLAAAELAELVRPIAGSLAPDGADELVRRTGGNPLFATELARLARDRGVAVAQAGVPGSVRTALDRRLAGVPQATRAVLAGAAVLGVEFRLDQLADACPGSVPDAVEDAEQAGLVRPAGPGRYAFSHGLVRDAVYAGIPAGERADTHGRVADVLLAARAAGGLVEPAVLAHHLTRAPGRAAEAVAQHLAAARAAAAVLGHADAARHYAAAVELLDLAPGAADRGELLLALGAARLAAGDGPAARATYLAAARHARLAGRAEHLGFAALGLGGGPTGFEVPRDDAEQIALLDEALRALPAGPLRTRVAARLSVALPEAEQERRRTLAGQALAAARDGDDPAVLTAALAAHCDLIAGPADAERRHAQAGEIVALARSGGDVETELLGRRLRLVAALERGEYGAADLEIDAFALRVATIRHPLYAWYPPLWRAMRLAMTGRLDEAQRQRELAEAAGARVGSFNAAILAVSQRWNTLAEAGRFAEGHATLLAFADRLGYLGPDMEVGIALAEAQAGLHDAARRRLDVLAPQLPGLPVGSEWPPVILQLAELVSLLGGCHPVAGWAYQSLLPHRERHGIDGIGAYSYGSLERHLGLLAAALGHPDTAREHLTAALAANERAGASLLVARTLRDAGVALGDAALLARAREAYLRLGVPHRVAELDGVAAPAPPPPDAGVFRRTGETWTLTWRGLDATVRDSKGMRDLARLLARPDTDLAAVELAGATVDGGDTGEVVDATARDAYRARLAVLDEELAAADAAGDTARSQRASDERSALVAQLSAAYGLGGRPRRTGGPAERARSAVGWRIRDALRRIDAVHPDLARHLRHGVRTGTFCRYAPETPVRWEL